VKKLIILIMCLMPMLIAVMPLHSQAYTTEQRSKTIHVVFDDSVSMVRDDYGDYVDRWGQAKYAMEVFAVMLEEKDTMRVYFLSDYDLRHGGNINAPARIIITGSEPAQARVSKIRNTVFRAANTPYDAVIKAYDELRNAPGDERWLVVMNDGDDFNLLKGQDVPNVNVDNYFSQYVSESDVRIVLLAIGDVLKSFKSNPGRRIYLEQAKISTEILGKITSICNRIFNRNRLNFTNDAKYEFNFDIPMIELLVFAQGPNIKIDGINGTGTSSPNETVTVRYSDRDNAPTYRDFIRSRIVISDKLSGTVATFRNVPKGAYSLNISGAQTVEVYYKPDVKLDVKLFDPKKKKNNEITTPEFFAGNYRIEYGIVNEEGKFFESSLLGTVEYDATVLNNGEEIQIKSGDTVDLKAGELKVNARSRFLEINTAENTITRRVLVPPTLWERIRDFVKEFWYIFALLLGLLLYWLLWGRKKRFPKFMKKKPLITVENDSGSRVDSHSGFLRIDKKTKWLPFCPETGTICAAADGKSLPYLKVKALGGDMMELTNTSDFSEDRLNGIEFRIGDQKLPEGSTRNKTMRCTAKIKSVYYSDGIPTTHTCSFENKRK